MHPQVQAQDRPYLKKQPRVGHWKSSISNKTSDTVNDWKNQAWGSHLGGDLQHLGL